MLFVAAIRAQVHFQDVCKPRMMLKTCLVAEFRHRHGINRVKLEKLLRYQEQIMRRHETNKERPSFLRIRPVKQPITHQFRDLAIVACVFALPRAGVQHDTGGSAAGFRRWRCEIRELFADRLWIIPMSSLICIG